ncbi:gliding motility-associated C-terminal domain-containing protein [candidate division KSB1 bacterium]
MKRFILIFGAFFLMKMLVAQFTVADFIANDICFGDSLVLVSTSVSSDTIISYEWDLDADGNFNDAFGDTVKVLLPVGVYSIGHRIVTNTGGANAIYKQITVHEMPIPDFSFSVPCFGDSTEFVNLSTISNDSIINLLWKFGDGFETDLLENPKHQYPAPGTYNVTLRPLSSNGCADSIIKTIEIFPAPTLTLLFSGDTIFYEGKNVTIEVLENYPGYTWSTGDTTSSITVYETGTYSVEILDSNGCTKTKSVDVIVLEKEQLVPMTLITPNGDGHNDLWFIDHIEACSQSEVTIYNRWGDEVYNNKGYDNNWDGKYEGSVLPEGTYYYVIDCDGQIYKGAVNILK